MFLWQLRLWIEMPDAPSRQITDELAVVTHVSRESTGSAPCFGATDTASVLGICWRMTKPARRELEIALVEQDRDGVKIAGMGLETQPVRFERDRTTTREGIKERGEFAAVLKHLCPRFGVDARIVV